MKIIELLPLFLPSPSPLSSELDVPIVDTYPELCTSAEIDAVLV